MAARLGRGRLAAALAVAAVSLVGSPAGAGPCAGHEPLPDKWTRILAPEFAAGPGTIADYDVHNLFDQRVVATNGLEVFTSGDAGCRWTAATLPTEGALTTLPSVGETKVVTQGLSEVRYEPWRPGTLPTRAVWAIGHTDVARDGLLSTQPRVLFSADGSAFDLRVGGLPSFGRPVAVEPLGGNAAVLLFKATTPAATYSFWTTTDAGTTWTQRGPGTGTVLDDFVVSGNHVWAWSSDGVFHADLGAALKQEPTVIGPIAAVEVAPTPAGPTAVIAYTKSGRLRYVSTDRGATWAAAEAPEGIHNVTRHPVNPLVRAISSIETNVLVEPPPGPFRAQVDYSPYDDNVSDILFAGPPDASGYALYASSATALYLLRVPLDFGGLPEPAPLPVDVEVRTPPRPKPPKPAIAPAGHVVTLREGQREVVGYDVRLPPVPTPLDVYFMTDSTGSMEGTIRSVQEGVQDIIDGLSGSGIDVNFGVADFRGMPNRPEDDRNYLYQRRREIGPLDSELAEALESITTGGGSATGADTGLEAIYQAVTGAGRKDPLGVRADFVAPGLGAEFRRDAMKVVFIATDDTFQHPASPADPIASIDTVSKVLRDHGVYLVGLEVETKNGSARDDMERLARDSGAVAPAGGVDCDGDGAYDIEPADPIVCTFQPGAGAAVGDAFVAMLSGIKDLAAIDLAVQGPPRFVQPLGALHYPDVNVKAASRYTLPVEFRCEKANLGTETPVRISAARAGELVVATTATLRCVAPDAPRRDDPPPPPLLPPAVAAVLLPPAPPPPPPPVSNANPPPNVNPNPNPNPQVNANAGFAAQDEQQVQLALVEDDGVSYEQGLAMSGLDRAASPVPALAWAAAVAMTGAAAYGARLARRASPALAFGPREHR